MRLFTAIKAFFRICFDGEFAARVRALADGTATTALPSSSPEPTGPTQADLDAARREAVKAPAVMLSLLQREGRLIDFITEDIQGYGDAQVGAAVRAVHGGCRKVFDEYVKLEPIQPGTEGSSVQVPAGFDPSAIRLSGKVKGDPPFTGTLHHHGWRIAELNLPRRPDSHTPEVVAPAEVEVV